MRVIVSALLLASALVMTAGCAKPYKMPEPGAPAAIVKIKPTYDQAKFAAVVPGNGALKSLDLSVTFTEGKEDFVIEPKDYTGAFTQGGSAPLEVHVIRLHPDREGVLNLNLSVRWQVTSRRMVTENVPKTRQVTKWVNEYDYYSKTYKQVQRTVLESYNETRQVEKDVTDHFSQGCTASVKIKPQKDMVYIIDYNNMMVNEGCTAQGFLQTPQPDGTFKMSPI